MKIYRDIIQGSDEWLAIRKGRPTASRFSEIITATGLPSKSSEPYIRELIAECFCPDFASWGGNSATERGVELEPEAREAFAKHTGLTLEQVGFVISDDGVCGCSPDSLVVGNQAGVEIKCPAPKAHVSYVLDGVLPDTYKQQVHGSMAITGLSEWHFWSYFPGLRPLHVIVKRDDYTAKLEDTLRSFVTRYKTAMELAVPKLKIT
jgi:putative phage-type endonuclease